MSDEKPVMHIVSKRETWAYILSKPKEFEESLVVHIATGGTLRSYSRNVGVPFTWIYAHVSGDPLLNNKYKDALNQRDEYMKQFLFDQFKLLAESDLSLIFNDDGSLKPVAEWPESVKQFVSSIEVDELFEGTGRERKQIGWTKKIKLWDKMKALEQLAKHTKFTVDSGTDSGKLTWEAILLLQIARERGAKDVIEVKPEVKINDVPSSDGTPES